MRKLSAIAVPIVCALSLWGAASGFGKNDKANDGLGNMGVEAYVNEVEHPESAPPADKDEKTEWAFARLRYPAMDMGGYRRRRGGGSLYYSWGIDSPKADRQFVAGVRRLTRLHARSIEEVVNLDDNEVYNWPWIYAVEVGHWDLTDEQCAKLRDYLLRGGFLMTDDFHGTQEWAQFMSSMTRVFPDRHVVDIPDDDPIFHIVYDLNNKIQVPGIQFMRSGRYYEYDGFVPRWRGIYDDKGRVIAAFCHNQDNGDAWEWADRPEYPENFASQAYRMGIDYIIYSMTH